MVELVATIIFFGSLLTIGIILFRKIPLLVELPEIPAKFNLKIAIFNFKGKIKAFNPLKDFSSEIFLQKTLSKIRILALKIENKIANYLQRLREKSQKKKSKENDNYWQELRTSNEKSENLDSSFDYPQIPELPELDEESPELNELTKDDNLPE